MPRHTVRWARVVAASLILATGGIRWRRASGIRILLRRSIRAAVAVALVAVLGLLAPSPVARAVVGCFVGGCSSAFLAVRAAASPFFLVGPSPDLILGQARPTTGRPIDDGRARAVDGRTPAGEAAAVKSHAGGEPAAPRRLSLTAGSKRRLPAGSSFSMCGCSWMLFYHVGA